MQKFKQEDIGKLVLLELDRLSLKIYLQMKPGQTFEQATTALYNADFSFALLGRRCIRTSEYARDYLRDQKIEFNEISRETYEDLLRENYKGREKDLKYLEKKYPLKDCIK